MPTHRPSRQMRLIAAAVSTPALAVTATMAVSYARPLGKAGYGSRAILGGYGGHAVFGGYGGHAVFGGYGGYGTPGSAAR